jgi:hypothetical protein
MPVNGDFSMKKMFLVFLFGVLFCSGVVHAGEKKRSSIHEIDAYAYLAEDKTLSETRSEAFALAKRQALEAARSHIKSLTKVENMELKYDLVKSGAEGAVKLLEQKDLGIEDGSRYHVWVRAEVEYVLNPLDDSQEMQKTKAPLTVEVWTEKKRYNDGEEIKIHVRGNRDWHGVVVNQSANGDLVQLLPNAYRRDNFFKGGKVYTIPGKEDRFSLEVTPPYGRDRILVYASDKPLGRAQLRGVGAGLGEFRGTREELGAKLRGIRPVGNDNGKKVQGQFFESSCEVVTKP